MDPSTESFLATLLGAFLGVYLPFLVSAAIEKKNFHRALDVVFAQCAAYTQGAAARANHIMTEASASWPPFTRPGCPILFINVIPPDPIGGSLVSTYGKFLRAKDGYSMVQADHNLIVLASNLRTSAFRQKNDLEVALGQLVEHSARRGWAIYRLQTNDDTEFSLDRYNILVDQVNHSPERKLARLRTPAD